jgi:hypothetical protein
MCQQLASIVSIRAVHDCDDGAHDTKQAKK